MNASNHRYDKSEFGYNQLTHIFVLALINTYFVIVAMTIGAKMFTKIQKDIDGISSANLRVPFHAL